ncbi:MAG: hypothetical protein B9J98_07240 [Candidatus Terraquivivens tikiterensis]|uniref:Uncharacterized protein n=1 Tax=Candidatus Terraquivivens tikiterensis TaxID=1980982 RepID=A0A2R7Y0X0_9ARCH|nr:MAG: hypothetical protein B9J98_07240 [Candidatus Terraquivivens tikiterensis]
MVITSKEAKLIMDKLDSIRLELLRLRAAILPEEELGEEIRELEEAKKEISLGMYVKLEELLKEL